MKKTANEICSLERWNKLCHRLDLSADAATYNDLIKVHAQSHRAYHTLEHIAACLGHLDKVRHLTDRPDEIEMALWFHDSIYKPFSSTNEEDSADWAADWLDMRGTPKPVIARISDHILDTKHHDAPANLDGQYMLDIDLSILGTCDAVYDIYEKNIRFEYKRVPVFIYRRKRCEILKHFLETERIYATDYFFTRNEDQARENLSRAIDKLS